MIDTSTAMRFMTNNFLESGYSALDVSSSADGFFISTALDPKQRTKVFRFGGRFTIDSSNNKIYVGGVTYTLDNGEYTGSTLASHIQTKIAASGVSVIYSSVNFDFSFSKVTNFTLNLATTANSVWQTLGFSTGVNFTGTLKDADSTRMHWPNEKISIDFGYQAPIGFVGLIGDLGQELRIPSGATINFKANTVDDETSALIDVTIPWYERGAFRFIDDIAGDGWQFVWLTITCPTASIPIDIGYLYIGDYSSFPEDRNIGTGFEETLTDMSMISRSDAGQIYGNPRTPMRSYSSLQVAIAKKEVTAFLKNIYKLKQLDTPFFICLDPTTYLSNEFDEHLALVRFKEPPTYRHVIRDRFMVGFSVEEAV